MGHIPFSELVGFTGMGQVYPGVITDPARPGYGRTWVAQDWRRPESERGKGLSREVYVPPELVTKYFPRRRAAELVSSGGRGRATPARGGGLIMTQRSLRQAIKRKDGEKEASRVLSEALRHGIQSTRDRAITDWREEQARRRERWQRTEDNLARNTRRQRELVQKKAALAEIQREQRARAQESAAQTRAAQITSLLTNPSIDMGTRGQLMAELRSIQNGKWLEYKTGLREARKRASLIAKRKTPAKEAEDRLSESLRQKAAQRIRAVDFSKTAVAQKFTADINVARGRPVPVPVRGLVTSTPGYTMQVGRGQAAAPVAFQAAAPTSQQWF